MAHRRFRDSRGKDWDAYDIVPRLTERRDLARRRARRSIDFTDRRAGVERRLLLLSRAVLPSGFAKGWLCFQSTEQKRRLTPIPGDWVACDERNLERYCEQAQSVTELRPTTD